MSFDRGDLLFGRIALREGLISREQLYDALTAQERNPSRLLGSIMVSRGYLRQEDVERILDLQRRLIGENPAARTLLGRILVDRGLATEYQVNEALRLQGRLIDLGIKPVPRLGDILIRRGYLAEESISAALQYQGLVRSTCPDCGTRLDVASAAEAPEDFICSACGAEVPFLFERMAASVHSTLESAERDRERLLPEEVRQASTDLTNHFGRYILLREIGRGGAGIVYRAWQRDLNRVVALKLLPHESGTASGIRTPYGDAEDLKRFYNETRAVAELSHPNVVPILDFGAVDNHFYYTMRFIDGITLDRLLREATRDALAQRLIAEPLPEAGLPPRFAAAVMRDIARAIQTAHDRGIFHRDLKPSNIILDHDGRPHVMDFGLAKVRHLGDSAYVAGVVMGTPNYMPPEQAEGDMERVDNLSDVYSLGAILYEMVAGRCPYREHPTEKVIDRLRHEPPQPLDRVAPHVPEALRRIVGRAMQRRKEDRYRSAQELADDLQRFLDGLPPSHEPAEPSVPTMWDRLKQILGSS